MSPPRLLITAGPTHEPIDAVRYIGNRSSGRLGIAIADAAADRGWAVTLLLGPTHLLPTNSAVIVRRYRTCADLGALLEACQPRCDLLIMAAAVADYRPKVPHAQLDTKLRRLDQTHDTPSSESSSSSTPPTSSGQANHPARTLELEPTEDLLAACAARRRPTQLLVGFALEPRAALRQSARAKLDRKHIDCIVANPLETMESDTIEAVLIDRWEHETATPGRLPKPLFAQWLLDRLAPCLAAQRPD